MKTNYKRKVFKVPYLQNMLSLAMIKNSTRLQLTNRLQHLYLKINLLFKNLLSLHDAIH